MKRGAGSRDHRRPWIRGCTVLLLLLLVPGQVLAHAGHGPILYDELDVRFLMPPGESGEVDFEMAQGETIEWEVQVVGGHPVYVEVHSHGFEFQRHEVFNGTTLQNGSFQAPFSGYFGVLVDNGGQGDDPESAGGPGGAGDETGAEEDGAVQGAKEGEGVVVRMRIEGWFTMLGFVNIQPLPDEPVQESPGPGLLKGMGLTVVALAVALRRRR